MVKRILAAIVALACISSAQAQTRAEQLGLAAAKILISDNIVTQAQICGLRSMQYLTSYRMVMVMAFEELKRGAKPDELAVIKTVFDYAQRHKDTYFPGRCRELVNNPLLEDADAFYYRLTGGYK
jgi:hypothetical protein